MKHMSRMKLGGVILTIILLVSACGGSSGGGGGGGGGTGATLTGTVEEFTAALETEKKSFFVQIRDFLFSKASAAVSGVTVTVGDQTATTGSDGSFTVNDIPEGDQTVTFTQNSASANYSLMGVAADETFTLNGVDVDGSVVSTAHTGTWTGVISMADGDEDVDYNMTLVIAAGGNALSGTMTVAIGGGEAGTISGTENGTTIDATYTVEGNNCVLSGPLTGTFDSDIEIHGNAPVTADSCGLQPGDEDPNGHPFHLEKT